MDTTLTYINISMHIILFNTYVHSDGSSGKVYIGEVPMVWSGADENFRTILRWADRYKRLNIFANAVNIYAILLKCNPSDMHILYA